MSKAEDWRPGLNGTLIFAMALLTGGAVLQKSAPAPSPTPVRATTAPGAALAESEPAALAGARPIIERLAEFAGVPLDAELTIRAAIGLRDHLALRGGLTARAEDMDDIVAALGVLIAGLPGGDPGAIQRLGRERGVLTRGDALRRLRALALAGTDTDAQRYRSRVLEYFEKGPDDYDNLRRIERALHDAGFTVDFVTATLPDHVDSQVGRLFDLILSGIQQAAAVENYTQDRFYFPDTRTAGTETRVLHESQPGFILFRAPPRNRQPPLKRCDPALPPEEEACRQRLLVVTTASETPTAGVHHRALLAALELEAAWREAQLARDGSALPDRPLRILGPTFSGTGLSLKLALERFSRRPGAGTPRVVHIVSGAGTARSLPGTLNFHVAPGGAPADADTAVEPARRPGMRVRFATTTHTSTVMMSALHDYLGRVNPRWSERGHVALLVESNTVFGRSGTGSPRPAPSASAGAVPAAAAAGGTAAPAAETGTRRPGAPPWLQVPFPLNISRLRSMTPATPSLVPGLSGGRVRLTLDDAVAPSDQLPSVTPELTSAVVDTALGNFLSSLRRERYGAIGITATDARDHLFLAREISREVPNAQMFGMQADLLYLNSDYAPFVRGTIFATTYPLFNPTQLVTDSSGAPTSRRQFSLNGEQGVYNAFVALLSGITCTDSGPCTVDSRRLVDYAPPGASCTDTPCVPPVWIVVSGRTSLWPLTFEVVKTLAEAAPAMLRLQRASPAAGTPIERRPVAYAEQSAMALYGLIILLTLAHGLTMLLAEAAVAAAHVRAASRSRRPALRQRMQAMFAEQAEGRFGMLRGFHYVPSQIESAPPKSADDRRGRARTRPRSVAQQCADQAHRGSLLVLFGSLAVANLWIHFWALVWARERPELVSNLVAAAAFACASVLGICIARLALNLWHGRRRPLRSRSWTVPGWLLNGVGWAVTAVAIVFALLAAALATYPWHVDGLTFTRVAALANGVSPTPPLLLLCGALYLLAWWNLLRIKMHRYTQLHGRWIGDMLSAGDSQFAVKLRRATLEFVPWLRVGTSAGLLPVAIGSAAVVTTWHLGFTPEGVGFTRCFWWLTIFALVAMARISGRAMFQAGVVRESLARVANHPIAGAFGRVARMPFDWRLSMLPLPRPALVPLVAEVRLFGEELQVLLAETPDLPDREAFADMADTVRAILAESDQAKHENMPILVTKEWGYLLELGGLLTRVMHEQRWSPRAAALPGAAATLLGRGETIVAYTLALVIRNLLARVVSSLLISLTGFSLILIAHLLYAFQGRTLWLRFDLACVGMAAVVGCTALVRFEKDRVLSVLRSTSGRIGWSGSFVYRIAVAVVLPLLLLVAAMFPEIGSSLANWIEPLQKALP